MTIEEKIKECERLIKVYTDCRKHEMKNFAGRDPERLKLYERNLDNLGSKIVNYKIILKALKTGKDPESDFPWEEF